MKEVESKLVVCPVLGKTTPRYAHEGDAGADLKASQNIIIPARDKALVATGIRLEIPEGYAGLIWPRSGLAVKNAIDTGAGVIDSHYRGEIKILLFNHSDFDFQIESGDRIAQIIIQKIERVQFLPVKKLSETVRDKEGFGSTGK